MFNYKKLIAKQREINNLFDRVKQLESIIRDYCDASGLTRRLDPKFIHYTSYPECTLVIATNDLKKEKESAIREVEIRAIIDKVKCEEEHERQSKDSSA